MQESVTGKANTAKIGVKKSLFETLRCQKTLQAKQIRPKLIKKSEFLELKMPENVTGVANTDIFGLKKWILEIKKWWKTLQG